MPLLISASRTHSTLLVKARDLLDRLAEAKEVSKDEEDQFLGLSYALLLLVGFIEKHGSTSADLISKAVAELNSQVMIDFCMRHNLIDQGQDGSQTKH